MPDEWSKQEALVLNELKENATDHKEMIAKLNKIEIELAMLKVKSGLWGGLAGGIPALIGLGYLLLKG